VPFDDLPGSPLQFFCPSGSDGLFRFFKAQQQILSNSSALSPREAQDFS
jgi:hypothetical protein